MEGNYGNDQGFTAPVKVGEELDVQIEGVGEKGDGIAKKDGFVIFVPNAKEGQNVKVRVTRVLRKVGFGEVIGDAAPAENAADDVANDAAEPVEEEPAPEDSEDFGEESGESEEKTE